MALAPIEEALKRIRRGEMVLVVDDEDRENEGDLTMAASWVTAEAINFMLRWARGLVCMPFCGRRTRRTSSSRPMVPPDQAGCDTAFTVSIDHLDAGSGIGARRPGADDPALRSTPTRMPDEFKRPGHVFPLRARPGGTLERRGHTEAAVDLARLAGLAARRRHLRGARRRRLARALRRTSRCSRASTASRWSPSTRSPSTAWPSPTPTGSPRRCSSDPRHRP